MRNFQVIAMALVVSLGAVLTESCATNPEPPKNVVAAQAAQPTAKMQLHQLAADFRRLAQQLDDEARVGTGPASQRKRALAQELRQEADDTDERAAHLPPAADATALPQTVTESGNPKKTAIEERFYYRRLADQLGEMVEHRRMEAETS
jgi:hypothetical protein